MTSLSYSPLIYPNINEKINYLNVLLIDSNISDYQTILNSSSNLQTLPIVYSNFSSKNDLLDLLQQNFTQINRIAIFTSENINGFLDNAPLFLDEELVTNNINKYSENVEFILNLIYDFNIKNFDFLTCNSLNSLNWTNYYDFLHKKTGVIIGTNNDSTKHVGDWIIKSINQKIEEPTYYKNIEKYMYLLSISDLCTITSGTYEQFEYEGNYIIKFNSDGECYFNYDNINVNYIIVGGGGSGGGDTYNPAGGGGGGGGIVTGSFNSVANNILSITIGSGGLGVLDNYSGYNGNSSSIFYNNVTYTAQGGYGGSAPAQYSLIGGNGGNSGQHDYNGTSVASGIGGTGGLENMSGSNGSNGGGGGGAGGSPSGGSYYGGNGSVTTYSVYYYGTNFGAGGGGGDSRYDTTTTTGGQGGNVYAGNGGVQSSGTDASPGYGGGGGGTGAYIQGTRTSGAGGSGTAVLYFSRKNPTPTPNPISNICFLANTRIHCDQGIYPISEINPKIHTIRNKKIVAITKSITQDKHLVRICKNAFNLNYPNKDIVLTKKHNIYYKGKMIEAEKFINYFDKIKLVKYNGEILYNILMEKYDTINVNNIICETLHPENIIAKLYMSYLSNDYKNKIIIAINNCITNNDYNSYKKIKQRLNKELEYVKYNTF